MSEPDQWQGPLPQPFEMLGYYEEFIDTEFTKFLGYRKLSECPDGRLLGSQGRVCYTLTHDIELTKGTKTYMLRASKKRPIQVATMIQILCGRAKPLPNDIEAVERKRNEIDLDAPRTF